MIVTGTALQMRCRIGRLMQQHHVVPTTTAIALAEPTEHPLVFEGLAATTDIDQQRMKLRAYAFGFPLRRQYRTVPLLYRHDPQQVAGTVDEIDYDERGNLRIRATVTYALAKRCGAFSIGARIVDYELRDEHGPGFFALVTCAELLEVSVTPSPANPHALVQRRYRASPQVECYGHAIALMKSLRTLAALLQDQCYAKRLGLA